MERKRKPLRPPEGWERLPCHRQGRRRGLILLSIETRASIHVSFFLNLSSEVSKYFLYFLALFFVSTSLFFGTSTENPKKYKKIKKIQNRG